jgi:amidase
VAEPRPQAFARPHPGLSHAGQQPSLEALAQIAANYGFEIASDRLEKFRALIGQTLGSYARLDELVEPTLPVKYPRKPGYRPSVDDNPLGAWYWKSQISGAAGGPLAGKTVAIKDNVCFAGVPMMNGTVTLEGYVPEADATIVTRILDAGGTILGRKCARAYAFQVAATPATRVPSATRMTSHV